MATTAQKRIQKKQWKENQRAGKIGPKNRLMGPNPVSAAMPQIGMGPMSKAKPTTVLPSTANIRAKRTRSLQTPKMNVQNKSKPKAFRFNKIGGMLKTMGSKVTNLGADAMTAVKHMRSSSGIRSAAGVDRYLRDAGNSTRIFRRMMKGKSGVLGAMLGVTAGLVGALSSNRHGRGM